MIVKGISKQVIVVEPKDNKLYDQAIFILSEAAMGHEGVTEQMIIKDAEGFLNRKGNRKSGQVLWPVIYMLIGAMSIGILWVLTMFR